MRIMTSPSGKYYIDWVIILYEYQKTRIEGV